MPIRSSLTATSSASSLSTIITYSSGFISIFWDFVLRFPWITLSTVSVAGGSGRESTLTSSRWKSSVIPNCSASSALPLNPRDLAACSAALGCGGSFFAIYARTEKIFFRRSHLRISSACSCIRFLCSSNLLRSLMPSFATTETSSQHLQTNTQASSVSSTRRMSLRLHWRSSLKFLQSGISVGTAHLLHLRFHVAGNIELFVDAFRSAPPQLHPLDIFQHAVSWDHWMKFGTYPFPYRLLVNVYGVGCALDALDEFLFSERKVFHASVALAKEQLSSPDSAFAAFRKFLFDTQALGAPQLFRGRELILLHEVRVICIADVCQVSPCNHVTGWCIRSP